VHPAIIDPSLWGKVHEVLTKNGHARSVETKQRSRTDTAQRSGRDLVVLAESTFLSSMNCIIPEDADVDQKRTKYGLDSICH